MIVDFLSERRWPSGFLTKSPLLERPTTLLASGSGISSALPKPEGTFLKKAGMVGVEPFP